MCLERDSRENGKCNVMKFNSKIIFCKAQIVKAHPLSGGFGAVKSHGAAIGNNGVRSKLMSINVYYLSLIYDIRSVNCL